MTPLVAVLIVALQAPGQSAADSLISLAGRTGPTALEDVARVRSLDVRNAVRVALAQSVYAPAPGDRERALVAARRLARAHAAVWGDGFLSAQVARFADAPIEWRRAKLRADSLRSTGSAALGREGLAAALSAWRESLREAAALADTAATAATAGSIGAGFYRDGQIDTAEVYLLRARTLAAAVGDRVVEGNALGTLAMVSLDRGELTAARRRLDEALSLRAAVGDSRGAAADHNNYGNLAWELGDLAEAARHFETALELNRSQGRDEVAATNLVNLAGLAAVAGEFDRALSLYRDALAAYTAAELEWDAADVLRGLAQLELRRGNYPAAHANLAEALARYDAVGAAADGLTIRRELAVTLAAMGRMQDALEALRDAVREAEGMGAPVDQRGSLALAEGDIAVSMNMLSDAERHYARAERLFAEAGNGWGQAEAWQGQGLLLLERDEAARADDLLAGAARAQEAAGDPRSAALTRTHLAEARARLGDREEARALLRLAEHELSALGDRVGQAWALSRMADLERDVGLPRAADSLYAAGLSILADLPAPDVRWRLHFGRALVARSGGALDVAADRFATAVAEIEDVAGSLVLPERRSAYRVDKLDAYAELALTEHMRGRADRAFDASERLRAREAIEWLRLGRLARPAGVEGELLEREHDLRVRMGELVREAEPLEPGMFSFRGPDPITPSDPAREALARARASYAELLLDIRERTPRLAEVVSPAPTSWRDVAGRLASEGALIEYLLGDSSSVAFVVTPDTVAAIELGVTRRDVARLVEFARATLSRESGSVDEPWRAALRRLHRHLILPLEESGLLAGTSKLVVVPHLELHYLPFAALVDDDDHFLVERYSIAFAPSASVWAILADRGPSQGRGTLALAPRTDALPGSRREVATIARLGNDRGSTLLGADASEDHFRRVAAGHRVLHLATYGVLNKHNPLFSFVDLAPGGGHDGRLEVHEIFELELSADLVVLSACNTALGSGALADVPAGDDWVGLTRMFLHAGARRVVATLWAVEDRTTADLMERFYRERSEGVDDTDALAAAQRHLLGDPETAHPFHWAGVVLVGHAGGTDGR